MNYNHLSKPFWAIGFILIFLSLQLGVTSGVQIVEMVIQHTMQPELSPLDMIVAMAGFTIIAIVLFGWLKWSPLPMTKSFVQSRPWGVLSWCLIASLGAIIPSAYLQELMPEWSDSIQRYVEETATQMVRMMNTTGGYAVICLLAPIAEEMVFRGAALRTLLEWQPRRRWLMIFLSTLLFAVAHMNPAQFLHPLLIGLLLGWMYERTGSILPGIIYHWANNTVAYLMTRLYQDPDITVTQIFGSNERALMAVGCSLLIFLPALYQLNLWMKRKG